MSDNKQFFTEASKSANANFMSADGTRPPVTLSDLDLKLIRFGIGIILIASVVGFSAHFINFMANKKVK